MNIFEIVNKFYNIEEEFNKIEKLFDTKLFNNYNGYPNLNFIDIANKNIFYWKSRQNLLSFDELKQLVSDYTKK